VLLVEDIPAVLHSIERALRASGHECVCARSAEEALSQLAAGTVAPLDAIISDVGLPQMSGVELVSKVREKHPKVPVVLLSGNARTIENLEQLGAGVSVLSKPFRPAALVELVESLTSFSSASTREPSL
jgi:two-component system C4-dicarboxylate transport response regulator DctD